MEIDSCVDPGKYLGLPILWGRSKVEALNFVKGKVNNKLQGWKKSLLTFAGREILIKAVANAIPIFPMSCFRFPKKMCKELDSLISNFWWGRKGNEGKIHWKEWKKLGRIKSEGGMGFRRLEAFNRALLAKTAWRVLQNLESLWCQILKGIYFPNEDFLNAKKGGKASWGWMSISEGREMLKMGLCWRIGNGEKVKIFQDKWIPSIEGCMLNGRELNESQKEMKVEKLIKEGQWEFGELNEILSEEEKGKIRRIRLPVLDRIDKYIWVNNRDGVYTVKEGYKAAMKEDKNEEDGRVESSYKPSKKLWNGIWKIKMPPKVKHFMWRVVSGALATKEALYRRKCAMSPECCLCWRQEETIEHMLFFCPWAKQCWFGSPLALKVEEYGFTRVDRWLEGWLSQKDGTIEYDLALFAGICWGIWKARCQCIFEETEVDPWACVARAMRLTRDYEEAEMKATRRKGVEIVSKKEKRWKKPEPGWMKVNIDACYKYDSKDAAIGIVGRDERGVFLGGIGEIVLANTPFMAECLAAMKAFSCAERLKCRNVILETDCQALYKHLSSMDWVGCEWESVDEVKQCIESWRQLKGWKIELVGRECNKVADHMAACALRGLVPKGWFSKPPPSLEVLMNVEAKGMEQMEQEKAGIG